MLKRWLYVIAAVCIPASMCLAQPESTGKYDPDPVIYPELGFAVYVPSPNERHTVASGDDTLLSEVYVSGDYAYTVKVTKTPANSIASTAIEQAIQAEVKSSPASFTAKRWEQDSQQKELFKGVTKGYEFDAAAQMQHPYLEKICKGKECVQSLAMAPLKGESSPIITVGVIGPKTAGNDVEVKAKYVAFTLARSTARPALAELRKRAGTNSPMPPMPSTTGVKPQPKRNAAPTPTPAPSISAHPSITRREPKPGVATIPASGAATSIRTIKKGDIELTGSIQSIAPDRKSLTLLVNQIRLPSEGVMPLSPARQKTVHITKLPAGISAGSNVIVIGKNAGVGKPIMADVLEPAR